MNSSLPILCGLSAGLAYAQTQIPVTATIKPGPRNSGSAWITIRNASKSPLTAVILTFPDQRYSVTGGVVRVRPEDSPGAAPPRTLFQFDSALHNGSEIKPGGAFRVRTTVVDPSGQARVAAAILADGQTFGDPARVKATLAQRRAMLRALPIVIRHFPTTPPPPGPVVACEAPPGPRVPVATDPMPQPSADVIVEGPGRGVPRFPLDLSGCRRIEHPKQGTPNFIGALAAALPEEFVEAGDQAVIRAVTTVDGQIQRDALALRGSSPIKVMAKLLAMLHAWQDGLSNSLPSLAAAP